MQTVLDVQFTFLDISRSTTSGQLPHCVLELHNAKTTTFASKPEAYLEVVLAEQFPENQDIVDQPACQGPTAMFPKIPAETLKLKRT
jgi:hypothetical protein